jgi:hypothetical protein
LPKADRGNLGIGERRSVQGHDPAHLRLIDDFHARQAAWLLVLPDLDPEIIDREAIRATLVEAVLRRAENSAEAQQEGAPPFYIDLDPGPPA